MLDEARLAASGRSFEQNRQTRLVRRGENLHFVADRQVVWSRGRVEMPHLRAFMAALETAVESFQLNRHSLTFVVNARLRVRIVEKQGCTIQGKLQDYCPNPGVYSDVPSRLSFTFQPRAMISWRNSSDRLKFFSRRASLRWSINA